MVIIPAVPASYTSKCLRRFSASAVVAAVVLGMGLTHPVWAQAAAPRTRAVTVTKADNPATLNEKLALQIALEREGFSPGIIDGKPGGKTRLAIQYFQQTHGLPKTAILDDATREALKTDPENAIVTYAVQQSDLDGITPYTEDWIAKSEQPRMGYYNVLDGLAEKFHTSKAMMQMLNPGVDFENLSAGTTLQVPGIVDGVAPKAAGITIDLPKKLIIPTDAQGNPVALFHCSIAAKVEKRPSGQTTIIANNPNPDYTWDPQYWPEVKGIDHKLIIHPGPRNPVGLNWIGLDLPGYGIHGTPQPEMIGKTGSHGCFRMANWDAVRLGKMVRCGQTVTFIGTDPASANALR